MFGDDLSHFKIMQETNPYKIKKLGGKIAGYNEDTCRKHVRATMLAGVMAKFTQNQTLCSILLDSGGSTIAEGSTDPYWGTGVHIHDRNVLNRNQWKNKHGGAMCDILKKVRNELNVK